jgi:putative acetyltransferase
MLIRRETPSDYAKIYAFVQKAFETAEIPDEHVHEYVEAMHNNAQKYDPDLALVAEAEGEIVGHIISVRTYVDTAGGKINNVLAVGPLSVLHEMRKQGVGSQLMAASLEVARNKGYLAAFLAGNPAYYSRFGYVPTYRHGIGYAEAEQLSQEVGLPVEQINECIMVYELFPDALKGIAGNIVLL